MFNKLIGYLKAFREQRFLYSIIFCYKHLPFDQSRYVPIRFYRDAKGIVKNGGNIILADWTSSTRVLVGQPTNDFEIGGEKTVLSVNQGQLIIKGGQSIRKGTHIDVRGQLILGKNGVLGPRCIIRAHNSIILGDYFRVAHETQLFDSNFHFLEKVEASGFYPCARPIKIGDYCWIGNRSTISPGTVLPNYTIVTSNSVVNKDLSSLPAYPTIGGIPAKYIRAGWVRVWDTEREQEYHKQLFPWMN